MLTLELEGIPLQFISIYKPMSPFDDGRPMYCVSFKAQNLDLREYGIQPNDKGLYNAKSIFAPIITFPDTEYERVQRAFAIADMRNISRDRLFVDAVADHLDILPYEHSRGMGLSLRGVSFGKDVVTRLLDNAFTIKVNKEINRGR